MCGRFTLINKKLIQAKYGLSWEPAYNIAPSDNVLISIGNNLLFTKPWGFSPVWYQSGKILINARIESLNDKPSYKDVIRCVVLADDWYEWTKEKNTKVELKPAKPVSTDTPNSNKDDAQDVDVLIANTKNLLAKKRESLGSSLVEVDSDIQLLSA